MALTKICGLSTRSTLDAALLGGAAYVGFVFFEASPRRVSLDAAADLAEAARGYAKVVALTVDPDDALVNAIATRLAPDFIQLHGQESPERARLIGARAGAGIIKALPVSGPADLDRAVAFEDVADHLMFDARPPADADRPGGHGQTIDWALLAGLRLRRPWFLAGGLTPENVAEAIAASGAPMVDVSSGVEGADGLKDAALIARFLAAASAAPETRR
ncbi:MAG: phosphoribosylanthranilate isomerase [Caulobacteraceae bacterium]